MTIGGAFALDPAEWCEVPCMRKRCAVLIAIAVYEEWGLNSDRGGATGPGESVESADFADDPRWMSAS